MPKITTGSNTYLSDVVGKVLTVVSKYKAILTFRSNNIEERALLMNDKIKYNGLDLPQDADLNYYIKVGSTLTFTCHKFDPSGPDRCGWYVAIAWCHNEKISHFPGFGFEGKCNVRGTVLQVAGRQGVLSFKNYDNNEKVFFLASKLYLYGNRAKDILKKYPEVEEGSHLMFDAVPCNESENEYHCKWFATVVWNGGKKPCVEYDTIGTSLKKFSSSDLLSQIKMITYNPRAVFIRGTGQILHILSEEYGLALGRIQPNRWHSILFHRSICFLLGMNLSSQDLSKIFLEGDMVSFIAVPAPKKFITQWIASTVSVYRDPAIIDQLEMVLSS